MVKWLVSLFAGSLLLFAVVLPGNHTEAEDAFEYSRLIEEGQGAELFHPHHLVYLPVQKTIYRMVQSVGYKGRSYYCARAVSMMSASAALCLFWLLVLRIQAMGGDEPCRRRPLLASLGLLFSYGFIRYACEVEIYLPAMALALGAVYSAVRARASWGWFIAGVIMASFALLMHTINAATSLIAIPALYLIVFRQWKRALIHPLAVGILVGAVYLWVSQTCGIFNPSVDSATEGWFRAGTGIKAVVGFGQCMLSGSFLFSGEAADRIQALFPYRVFDEEIFAANHAPVWLLAVAPVTFMAAMVGVVGATGRLLVRAIRCKAFDRLLFVLLLWLGATMFPTVILEPSNPELWILSLAPLWMVFLWFSGKLPATGMVWMYIAIGLLGIHNITAGMGIVKSREGDYNYKKAEWVLRQAAEGDTIHTSESFVFSFYLDYWGAAEVRNVNTQPWKPGEITYVFDDVFNPSSAIAIRYPDHADRISRTAEMLQPLCDKIYEDEFGGIWVVKDVKTQ